MSVGSYILGGTQKGQSAADVDLNTAASVILKQLGERPNLSPADLLSITGFGEATVRSALEILRRGNLVRVTDQRIELTPQGEKARFLVAS